MCVVIASQFCSGQVNASKRGMIASPRVFTLYLLLSILKKHEKRETFIGSFSESILNKKSGPSLHSIHSITYVIRFAIVLLIEFYQYCSKNLLQKKEFITLQIYFRAEILHT